MEDKKITDGNIVPDFLLHVARATLSLSKENVTKIQSNDVMHLVEIIAQSIVRSCHPSILIRSVEDLPVITRHVQAADGSHEEDNEVEIHDIQVYEYRRTDYLRLLLRFIAPISMQISAQILQNIFLKRKNDEENIEVLSQSVFLLYSHWLPVAPHLTPLALDMLEVLDSPWKSLDKSKTSHIFLFVEASYNISSFFVNRRQIGLIDKLWDWTFLFQVLNNSDVDMEEMEENDFYKHAPKALHWYSVRALTNLLDWKPQISNSVLERLEISEERVPWRPHPWNLLDEERIAQGTSFCGKASLWDTQSVGVPHAQLVCEALPKFPYLADVGNGISFYRRRHSEGYESDFSDVRCKEGSLIPTKTTCKNIAKLGAALSEEPYPPPIILCGPQGSGKSSVLREMLRMCRPTDSLLEFHVDEETDSKTLIGSYSTTDIPGEFAWRPGALTHASREGRWVLFEDIDSVPLEIQATITKLLEDRLLPLGSGEYEKVHPDFRIFGTCTTLPTQKESKSSERFNSRTGGGKRIFSSSLWRKVHVEALPFLELKDVSAALFPQIPESVIDVSLSMMKALDRSGRDYQTSADDNNELIDVRSLTMYTGGRNPSVRDLFKLLSRISRTVVFEGNVSYTTEAQRTLCLVETVETFVGSCPDFDLRLEFVVKIAAPAWGVSGQLARAYIESRCPTTQIATDFVEIGRVKIDFSQEHMSRKTKPNQIFAQTNHSLRLMESIGVCVRQNEPVLLVGETGCGKTTVVQHLATLCDRELLVQNLSLQTDSTDLLGGFKPLELKNVARKLYMDFVDLFCSTFSRKQNSKFLEFSASLFEAESWKKLSKCFHRAANLGNSKMKERGMTIKGEMSRKQKHMQKKWDQFKELSLKFERQIVSCDAGLAFVFSEGVLVDAIKTGKWVLLDEINLASSDTLQRLCGLLDDPTGSVTLTERGDASEIPRHPDFRLFAAMNPATDSGKKELPVSIRARFSEMYVNELLDPVELRIVSARYLDDVLPQDGRPTEHTDVVISVVEIYLKCKELAETTLSDGAGHKPRYTLRTLSRGLSAAKAMVLKQRISLQRALYEGLQLAFEGALNSASVKIVKKILSVLLPSTFDKSDLDQPGRRPGSKYGDEYVIVKPFWLKAGPKEQVDWSVTQSDGKAKFILTPSVLLNLRRLSRALASGPWPILLEGPTSAGKTSLVEYIAARTGHHVIRINNHEHTDIQEYTGSFTSDSNGSLSFRDGLLVQALRRGHWVILDELNLAPSEVLEALNRLLDDNRELFLAETNETVKPHPDFRLFATQNPSGAYGGRKPLSRAFRNRFVEIHMADIPSKEMVTILEKRCGCPPSTAVKLVEVMVSLRYHRSKSNLFMGKDGFITPRDLLRWAERKSSSRLDFAEQGYMLLAERLRIEEEKKMVQSVLEEHLKVKLNPSEMYFGPQSVARKILENALQDSKLSTNSLVASIAPTRSLLRLLSLVLACIEQKEPVLLVGDTGCGKTTVVQFLSMLHNKQLYCVNCHATTETSDLLGGLRPIRGRDKIQRQVFQKLKQMIHLIPGDEARLAANIPSALICSEPGVVTSTDNIGGDSANGAPGIVFPEIGEMVSVAQSLLQYAESDVTLVNERISKRRKIHTGGNGEVDKVEKMTENLNLLYDDIQILSKRYNSLFEWSDGPLVTAMKSGQMLLLDEMSLAEDAVLERLNSVLEPSRTLVLAEKGEEDSLIETRVIMAHDNFRIFATMNPGGDFGKRELSPALRSRFTEIWVPSITEREDFELVLYRTLSSLPNQHSMLVQFMLDYVEWFNKTLCGDMTSVCANYDLSLRDVLSWAHFIQEAMKTNVNIGLWQAYIHGVALMHLDGLGLGAGLAIEDATVVREKCQSFISKKLLGIQENEHGFVEKYTFSTDRKTFGAAPFFVPLGLKGGGKCQFDMSAPTTAKNAFRVLRALQIKKPILLEGSPGVGKTSLVTALAIASGNELVRINLSEQTDIADLMGSDLPVQDSSSSGASFEWSDGVLLRAIKGGNWVLLDELNLASQSVLEGLNSCLDHRAAVYIPELGKSFVCPPTFRVFGAQNPLFQGGGRKGLPKSFLNRFTKVYVDPLTDFDLRTIVNSRHPSFRPERINNMIEFNKTVQTEIVEKREYGSEGSPWEFNLRDIFRWCDLIERQPGLVETSARDIYLQRLRTGEDRLKMNLTFQRRFNSTLLPTTPLRFKLSDDSLKIGNTIIKRSSPHLGMHKSSKEVDPELLLSLLLPMEALSRCIVLQWPCLVIGPPSSGKTAAIKTLANLCNAEIVEHSLSPSSDVTELLGCFEQADGNDFERDAIKNILSIVDVFFNMRSFKAKKSAEIWQLSFQIRDSMNTKLFDKRLLLENMRNICDIMKYDIALFGAFPDAHLAEKLDKLLIEINHRISQQSVENTSHFVWKDGVLVDAMIKGQWLVLNNVNLCPSSVLDRLNSTMEIGGELLLSECGMSDSNGEESHRVIKPHANFRIFLTMDPANGEISRAMRNRCIELFMPSFVSDKDMRDEVEVDLLHTMHTHGTRSVNLASTLISCHRYEHQQGNKNGEEIPCLRNLTGSTSMVNSMLYRGVYGRQALCDFLSVGYELNEHQLIQHVKNNDLTTKIEEDIGAILPGSPIRKGWAQKASVAHTEWEARVLYPFVGSSAAQNFYATLESLPMKSIDRFEFLGSSSEISPTTIVKVFLMDSSSHSLFFKTSFFDGLNSQNSYGVCWMIKRLQQEFNVYSKLLEASQSSGQTSISLPEKESIMHKYLQHSSALLTISRLDQLFSEHLWRKRCIAAVDILPTCPSVLEISYLMAQSLIDQTMVNCPVTPFLYALFVECDRYISTLFAFSVRLSASNDRNLCDSAMDFLKERDRLWQLLSETYIQSKISSFLSFEESEFLVQWKWFKRAMQNLVSLHDEIGSQLKGDSLGSEGLISLVAQIDSSVYGTSNSTQLLEAVNRNLLHPCTPRTALHWQSLVDLKNTSRKCSLEDSKSFSTFDGTSLPYIDVSSMLESCHPVLYVDQKFEFELLAAITTAHACWTEEVKSFSQMQIFSLPATDWNKEMRDRLKQRQRSFELKLNLAKVDMTISTIENQLTVANLEELKDSSKASAISSEAYAEFTSSILSSFSSMQLSAYYEYISVIEERELIGELCQLLVCCTDSPSFSNKLQYLLSSLKNLVNSCLQSVMWRVHDLRPFQTLIWVIENIQNSEKDLEALRLNVIRLIPDIFTSIHNHSWSNLYNHIGLVSNRLEVPSMWIDDEHLKIRSRLAVKDDGVYVFGLARIRQQVRTEIVLQGFGEHMALQRRSRGTHTYTIENFDHRIFQGRSVATMLSKKQKELKKDDFWMLTFLVHDTLRALRDGLQCHSLDKILSILENQLRFADQSPVPTDFVFGHHFVDTKLSQLILPLLNYFNEAHSSHVSSTNYLKAIANISVCLGLLRILIAVPPSPLDPGRAPFAKVSLIDRRLATLRHEVSAYSLYSGFNTGDFIPKSAANVHLMLSEGNELMKTRASEEKKIVQRPESSKPFHELFRISRDFVQNVASPEVVLGIVKIINTNESGSVIQRRVDNWIQTAASFSDRIKNDFLFYDDVTINLLHSVQMIQEGLSNLLALTSDQIKPNLAMSKLFRHFLEYPISDYFDSIALSVNTILKVPATKPNEEDSIDLRFALALSILSRVLLKKTILGESAEDLRLVSDTLQHLSTFNAFSNVDTVENEKTLEEVHEQKFLEQFPDHRQEFSMLFREDNDEFHEEESDDNNGNVAAETYYLSEQQIYLICFVLRQIFALKSSNPTDRTRTMAFHFGYNAALAIEKEFSCTKTIADQKEPMGGHILGLALGKPTANEYDAVFPHLSFESDVKDFHNEPSPAKILTTREPLRRLMARATQLLTAFPGHSILLGIGRVCDKVCKFDIMKTPIGKVMTGMEVILRQAQEWEQHASDRVRLGESLQEVGKLVTSWRKLELESWANLLLARKDRYRRKACRHLMRLQAILSHSCEDDQGTQNAALLQRSVVPSWIWKGNAKVGSILSTALIKSGGDDLKELTRILDTFVLTSPLGEFQERIDLLYFCAHQQKAEYRLNNNLWSLQQSRTLYSLHSYYKQFEQALNSKVEAVVSQLQKKLKDEVKLAKWDEQTYYALAESTERNHRKLMKILTELDDCLDLNVGLLIQEERVKGIRSEVDSNVGASTLIPSNSSIFPSLKAVSADVRLLSTESSLIEHNWTDLSIIGQSIDSDFKRMEKYFRKMNLLNKSFARKRSWARLGTDEASELCSTIFNRIDSLRTKSLRPMKERALVDLFRSLRQNGFTSTKWGVPDQIRIVEDLFQLSQPDTIDSKMQIFLGGIARAENYYQRVLTELNEFRSENLLLGSKHLTKRETSLMLSFGESGLFLVAQQRCTVSSVLSDLTELGSVLESLAFENLTLPMNQETQYSIIREFDSSYLLGIESLCQLKLWLKYTHGLRSRQVDLECTRDCLTKIEGCTEKLKEHDGRIIREGAIVTYEHLEKMTQRKKAVDDVYLVVSDCKEACSRLSCVPLDVFSIVLDTLEKCRQDASQNEIGTTLKTPMSTTTKSFMFSTKEAIKQSLIGFQGFLSASPVQDSNYPDDTETIWECHKNFMNAWAACELSKLNCTVYEVLRHLRNIHNGKFDASAEERETLVGLCRDLRMLGMQVYKQGKILLETSISFYAECSKLTYVLMRVFRLLLSKGFCSDETKEDDASDNAGDAEGMTFEDDQEGTGMGEGDGKQDVTDQLESEEQLSGLKNDHEDLDEQKNESRQLNEDEANQGMEMEQDFDGEMCDVPDQHKDDEADSGDDQEELEREMGDEKSPDEQVVDERMWNESDNEEDVDDDEKFEKDSGVEGEAIDGATRTKEDEEEKPKDDAKQDEKKKTDDVNNGEKENQADSEGEINDNDEEMYEDQHGVDVKGEDSMKEEVHQEDEAMDLKEDMDLDDDDGHDDTNELDEKSSDTEENDDGNSIEGSDDHKEFATASDAEDENDDDVEDGVNDAAKPSGAAEANDTKEDSDSNESGEDEKATQNVQNQPSSDEQAHGVRANDGQEGILDDEELDADDENQDDAEGGADTIGEEGGAQSHGDSKGASGVSDGNGVSDESNSIQKEDGRNEIPNPFKNPGDASKFWHKKLNIVENSQEDEHMSDQENANDVPQFESNDTKFEEEAKGDFEYTVEEKEDTTQVLGETQEEGSRVMKQEENSEKEDPVESFDSKKSAERSSKTSQKQKKQSTEARDQIGEERDEMSEPDDDDIGSKEEDDLSEGEGEGTMNEDLSVDGTTSKQRKNEVVSDLSKLKVDEDDVITRTGDYMVIDEQIAGISSSEAAEARKLWLQIQGETFSLSRRLCEKLRLVMEPLVASKLRGDYRTGKRINMKRVIGYIASGYRKDKIWLRRTKPAKRDYRILLAVDDSESMKKSGAGEMALKALATLAIGMNQLEIGELGIASFGEEMNLLHPFHLPFNTESGVDMVMNFRFDQKRTRTSLCVESAIAALENAGGSSSMQLVFMISDGRIERDSRDKLKRLIRDMMERNILLAMIIVEGDHKKKDSIVNMKEVTFEKGKPVVKRFIEDYPFPYYIILEDMLALPEVLGDALRQWFEMLTQLQSPR